MDSFFPILFFASASFFVIYIYYGALGKLISELVKVEISGKSTLDLTTLAMVGFLTNGIIHYLSLATFGHGVSLYLVHSIVFLIAMTFGARKYFSLWATRLAELRTMVSTLSGFQTKLFYGSIVIFCGYSFNVFIPQTHGDAYLYHLTVGRIWWLNDTVLVDPSNVTTGYSWAVESGYSFIRMFFGESVMHIVLGQMHHFVFGLLSTVVVINAVITRLGASPLWAWCSGLLFINPPMAQHALTAKNDGVALCLVSLFAYFLLTEKNRKVLLISFFAITAKITAALGLAYVSVCYLVYVSIVRRGELLQATSLIFKAAMLSVLGILPFIANNLYMTNNPFFPILNNIFKSPLVPETSKSIVQEMAPLSLTMTELLDSIYHLFVRHPYFIFLPVIMILLLKQNEPKKLYTFISLLVTGIVGWVFYQYALGAYHIRVEERHFKFAVYIIGISLLLGLWFLEASRTKRFLSYLIWISIVAHITVDVRIREIYQGVKAGSLKQNFLSYKPEMKTFDLLSQSPLFKRGDVVLSLRGFTNESYFLPLGFYHHKSLSSYMLKDPQLVKPENFNMLLEKSGASYVLMDNDQKDYDLYWGNNLKRGVVARAGSVSVYSVQR